MTESGLGPAPTPAVPRKLGLGGQREQANLWPRVSPGEEADPEIRAGPSRRDTCPCRGHTGTGGTRRVRAWAGGEDSALYVLTSLASTWTRGLAALTAQGSAFTACPNSAGRLRQPGTPAPGGGPPTITPCPPVTWPGQLGHAWSSKAPACQLLRSSASPPTSGTPQPCLS